MKIGDLLKRRTPLLVTTGSEAGGEGTGVQTVAAAAAAASPLGSFLSRSSSIRPI